MLMGTSVSATATTTMMMTIIYSICDLISCTETYCCFQFLLSAEEIKHTPYYKFSWRHHILQGEHHNEGRPWAQKTQLIKQ